jgi:ribonuclease HI
MELVVPSCDGFELTWKVVWLWHLLRESPGVSEWPEAAYREAGVYGQSEKRRLSFSLGKYATVFQAEIYAILACIYEIKTLGKPEKRVSICSDNRTALNALKAIRTMSLLDYQCQNVLNDISAVHAVGLYWVPGHAGARGNEIADGLARYGAVSKFVGPKPPLGVSRQDPEYRTTCCKPALGVVAKPWQYPTTGLRINLGNPAWAPQLDSCR